MLVRLPSYIPLLAFLLFTAVAVVLLKHIEPALMRFQPPVIGTTRTADDDARFASATLGWAAVAAVTTASLVGAMAYSAHVVWTSATNHPKLAVAGWAAIVGALAAAVLVAEHNAATGTFWTSLVKPPLLRWPLTNATLIGNALGLASVAGLFVAAGALISAYRDGRIEQPVALDRLRWLLVLGAVATVCGVIEIRTIHRLPGAAIATADMRTLHAADDRSVYAALLTELRRASDPETYKTDASNGTLPLLTAVVDQTLGSSVPAEAKRLLRHHFAMEARATVPSRDSIDMVATLTRSRDEAARVALVSSMDDVAAHMASFWGAVFSVGLAFLYIPAAAVLTTPRKANHPADRRLSIFANAPVRSAPAPDSPVPPTPPGPPAPAPQSPAGTPSLTPRPFADQFLALAKILTALAPLLAGLVAEVLKSVLSVSG